MRAGAWCGVMGWGLLVGAGCGGGPPSSFESCSRVDPCGAAEETCYTTHGCDSIPDEEGRIRCGPELGDLQCHQDCSGKDDCAAGETCCEVTFYQGDAIQPRALCFKE
jgi:hypothetical protein